VVRFAERTGHGVFLEPESHEDECVYCNGISTSLPRDVQDEIVRLMPGCERAGIVRYGYAVEYDMVRPHQIFATGMTKVVEGLFLAGQINGTSGYEEAAAQGLVAGVNAVRWARGEGEWVLGREEAYIGVLMDDLVTRTPVEPYRMFTSRAEHRLLLRADNSADRLTPVASRLGLLEASELGTRRMSLFDRRVREKRELNAAIEGTRIDGVPVSTLIRRPEFDVDALRRAVGDRVGALSPGVWASVHADRRYEAYVARQQAEIKRQGELERRRIPVGIDFERLGALRAEARQALARFRPATFGQAARLEGVTPADLTLLGVLVKRAGFANAG
jgi:tRNA uridine 5-carboxymethylaminomethyl modification enzyme